ncbi:MAG: hypothetical protein V3V10_09180 [Planctomycetota bacterium]
MKYLLLTFAFVLFSSVAYAQGYTLKLDWNLYGDPPSSGSNPMSPWQHVCDDLSGYVIVDKSSGPFTTFDVTTVMHEDSWAWVIQNNNTVAQGSSSTTTSSMLADPAIGLWVQMTTVVDTSGGEVDVSVEASFWLYGQWFFVDWGIEYTDFAGPANAPSTLSFDIEIVPPPGTDPTDIDFRSWLADTEWWVE